MFKKAAVYIKEKINKNGFTFAEMLFAVLILGIATGLMAQTVGVAFNNFEKITKKSEAQMLCSVLVASVQDELLYAKNIKAGTVPEYFSSSRDMGESCKIVAATYSGSDSADAYSGRRLMVSCMFIQIIQLPVNRPIRILSNTTHW